jgi:Uma2 family endonuclease
MQAEQSIPAVDERISFEDFLVRYDGVSAEWIDGAVELMSPVTGRHNLLTRFISNYLECFCDLAGIASIIYTDSMVMRLGDRAREPDVMLLLEPRWMQVKNVYVDGPADLVVEVISPESDLRDRTLKLQEYEAGGVTEYWIIDPVFQEALFLQRNADGQYARVAPAADGKYVASQVLPGLSLPVAILWQNELPSLLDIVAMLQADLGGRG